MVDTHVNTERVLLDEYLKKPKVDSAINTAPVIFGSPRKPTASAMIQTEPIINEYGLPDEPLVGLVAHEPVTA